MRFEDEKYPITCRNTVKQITAIVVVRNMPLAGTEEEMDEARPNAIAPRRPP